jgi:uncharacterized coiled-coil protein SlyX
MAAEVELTLEERVAALEDDIEELQNKVTENTARLKLHSDIGWALLTLWFAALFVTLYLLHVI